MSKARQQAAEVIISESAIDTENRLVGEYLQEQQTVAGATTVDLKRIDDIRTGIRLALA